MLTVCLENEVNLEEADCPYESELPILVEGISSNQSHPYPLCSSPESEEPEESLFSSESDDYTSEPNSPTLSLFEESSRDEFSATFAHELSKLAIERTPSSSQESSPDSTVYDFEHSTPVDEKITTKSRIAIDPFDSVLPTILLSTADGDHYLVDPCYADLQSWPSAPCGSSYVGGYGYNFVDGDVQCDKFLVVPPLALMGQKLCFTSWETRWFMDSNRIVDAVEKYLVKTTKRRFIPPPKVYSNKKIKIYGGKSLVQPRVSDPHEQPVGVHFHTSPQPMRGNLSYRLNDTSTFGTRRLFGFNGAQSLWKKARPNQFQFSQ
jgi:hypothetical protein